MFGLFLSLMMGCVDKPTPRDSAEIADSSEPVEELVSFDTCSFRIGENICNIESVDQNADVFNLYSYHGRPIVIDLSTMWCPVCQRAAPYAEQFMTDWADYDLLWVTILIEDEYGDDVDASELAQWSLEHGIVDSLVVKGGRNMLDLEGLNGFPATGWPTFVFIDENLLIFHGVGGWSEEYVEQKLTEMLALGPE